jgi:cytidylate kinase
MRQGLRLGEADSEAALAELVRGLRIHAAGKQVHLGDEDVSRLIRTPEVTRLSRAVADSPAVRSFLSGLQREAARAARSAGRSLVTEGRDQGTFVFPDAECKFFLTADPAERARRRHRELEARGQAVTLAEVLQAQEERDRRDAARTIAPMKPAVDAMVIDTTGLTIEEMIAAMARVIQNRERGVTSP